MRHLPTHPLCKKLKQKRLHPPQDELRAKRAWRRFNKKDTRKNCCKRQLGLCAYTELSLNTPEMGHHLEHIAPRSRFPERTFMQNNIVLSALSDELAGSLAESERFAGHHKLNQYDDWFISPYKSDCERFFDYCPNTGQVLVPHSLNQTDQQRTKRTIEVLNLNCQYLTLKRHRALAALKEQASEYYWLIKTNPENHSKSSINQVFAKYSQHILEAVDGQLPEFFSAKKQLLSDLQKTFYKNG